MCDAAFDQQDAEVVCRELDCGAPVQVLGAAAFVKGDTQMWTQEIQCRGNESQIRMCPASQKHSCSHDDQQALLCAGKKINMRAISSITMIICVPLHLVGPSPHPQLQRMN